MPCIPIQTPGGFGFACSRGRQALPRCYSCRKAGQWLCDYPTGEKTTCDRPICRDHGQAFPSNLDYCQEHAALALKASTP